MQAVWNKRNNSTTEHGFNSSDSQSGSSVTSRNSQPNNMDVKASIEDNVESGNEEDTTIPSTTDHSYQNTLKSHLPFNSLDGLNMLLCFLNNITCPCPIKSELKKLTEVGYRGNLNQRQLHYRVNKVCC